MNIEKIIELVSNSDLKDNSELIESLGTLISPSSINLDLISTDEKFADLLKAINSNKDAEVGRLQNKWKEELKKKEEDNKKKIEIPETKNKTDDLLQKMLEKIEALENKSVSDMKLKSVKLKANELIKDLHKNSQKLILNSLSSETTDEELNEKITIYNELEKSFKKAGSPGTSPSEQNINKVSQAGIDAHAIMESNLKTKYNIK